VVRLSISIEVALSAEDFALRLNAYTRHATSIDDIR
jgi:hypothetical protein